MCFNLVQAGDEGVVLKQFKCDIETSTGEPGSDHPSRYPLKDAKKWEDDKKGDHETTDEERKQQSKHFCNFGQFTTA